METHTLRRGGRRKEAGAGELTAGLDVWTGPLEGGGQGLGKTEE